MTTTRQVPPGIRRIYHLNGDLLPERTDLRDICRMPIDINFELTEIPVASNAECSCLRQRSGAGDSDTATLRFLTTSEVNLAAHPAFVVEDVEGNSWLIGSLEAPRPVVSRTALRSTPSGDRAGWLYEVTHTALRSMILCNVFYIP